MLIYKLYSLSVFRRCTYPFRLKYSLSCNYVREHIKNSGIFVWGIVYDLLPILPDWWPAGGQKHHLDWFRSFYILCNGYSCISEDVLRSRKN